MAVSKAFFPDVGAAFFYNSCKYIVHNILSCTGNPYFTTDSGAALRALEIKADALLKGTRVDGVYTADPEKDPQATRYEELSFAKALSDRLKVMDATAFALCEQGPVSIIVFNVEQDGNLARLLDGEKIGTVVHA